MSELLQIVLTFDESTLAGVIFPCDTWVYNCQQQTINQSKANLLKSLSQLTYKRYAVVFDHNEIRTVDRVTQMMDTHGVTLFVSDRTARRGRFHLLTYPTGPFVVDSSQQLIVLLVKLLHQVPPTHKDQLVVNACEVQNMITNFVIEHD